MELVKKQLDLIHNSDGSIEGGEKERHLWTVRRRNAGWYIYPGYDEPGDICIIGYVITKNPWNDNNLVDTEPHAEFGAQSWMN